MSAQLPIRRVDPDDWVVHASCRGRGELFFPPDTSESRSERRAREERAKQVCVSCYVRLECLAQAISTDEKFGIWGGLNARERRAYARDADPPHDIPGPGRSIRLPAVVVQGRRMSSRF